VNDSSLKAREIEALAYLQLAAPTTDDRRRTPGFLQRVWARLRRQPRRSAMSRAGDWMLLGL